MTFALKELASLLTQDTPTLGAVVGIKGNFVRVATPQGAALVRTLDTLVVGDRVLIRNGLAMRAPVARQTHAV